MKTNLKHIPLTDLYDTINGYNLAKRADDLGIEKYGAQKSVIERKIS